MYTSHLVCTVMEQNIIRRRQVRERGVLAVNKGVLTENMRQSDVFIGQTLLINDPFKHSLVYVDLSEFAYPNCETNEACPDYRPLLSTHAAHLKQFYSGILRVLIMKLMKRVRVAGHGPLLLPDHVTKRQE